MIIPSTMYSIACYAILMALLVDIGASERCYWNHRCKFDLYSTKTPYDTVRGDMRDAASLPNCKATSVWSIHRHGNRNPGSSVIESIKQILRLQDDIISSYNAGTSQLCAQDIEDLQRWRWNETIDSSASYLTGVGYEELYDIGKRIRETFPHLLETSDGDKLYFRTTNEQRTITSSMAFVHSLTEDTDLNVSIDGPWERDDVIRPYENCQKYQDDVKGGETVSNQLAAYYETPEYVAVIQGLQQRLGISQQLTADEVYSLYELCRFYRSWSDTHLSPWCAVFTDQDLVVLEYRDDIRHFYRNGYGSTVNVQLGGPAAKDLFLNFEAAVRGEGRNLVSYFTHDTMMEMFFCALGLFKDDVPITSSYRDEHRQWRTSFIAAFATNFVAVLNSCNEGDSQNYRVQFYVNERETNICPSNGCTYEEFQNKFSQYEYANLDFCTVK